jgi:hypothetical protein
LQQNLSHIYLSGLSLLSPFFSFSRSILPVSSTSRRCRWSVLPRPQVHLLQQHNGERKKDDEEKNGESLTNIRLDWQGASLARERGRWMLYPKGRQGGGRETRESYVSESARHVLFVNVGRRLSFMFKLGTEAGQKRESVFALLGNWEG